MKTSSEIFGVIAEFKEEQPIVMEAPLVDYEAATVRMHNLAARSDVIRVAVFKAVYAIGNNTLLPKESEPV